MTESTSVRVDARVRGGAQPTRIKHTIDDRDEAEKVVSDLYLPNQLDLADDPEPLRMEVSALRLGALTAGRLTYGRGVRLRTAEAEQFHINFPLRGRAVSSSGTAGPVATHPGDGLVFSPGAPADMTWSEDCEQLCLMVPRTRLEAELDRLCGRPLKGRLTFDFAADLDTALGRRLRTVVGLITDELDDPTDLSRNPQVLGHVEALVVDALLLCQSHSHSDLLSREGPATLGAPIRRAVDLVEERPAEPWTTVRLAAEVHLSVRALQAGFRRDLSTTPTTYVRQVRLRKAREALLEAQRSSASVQTVALGLGIVHLGRFAAAYREAYGESPSETLAGRS